MTCDDTTISLKMPSELVEKLDAIAKQKYLKRSDIIIDSCAYYCQFHDINREQFPETMRNIFLISHVTMMNSAKTSGKCYGMTPPQVLIMLNNSL